MRRDDFIRGAGGGGKGGGGGGGIDESPDTLSSVTRARFVDLLGEGEIAGLVNNEYSIYLDGVPLKATSGTPNYRPFRWASRNGTQSQTPLPGFTGTQSETSVGLKVIKSTGALVRSVPDADADVVRVTVAVNGLSQTTGEGKITGTKVQYTIRVRVVGGSWVTGYSGSIDGKTRGRYQRSHDITLTDLGAGPYEVSVERITDDSESSLLVNDLFWDSYTIVNYEQFSYPNSALVGLEIDARYFSNVPARAYHVRGLLVQVPKNYDPVTRTYATTGPGTTAGAWDGTFKVAYTNNPAWCYYDLLLNPRYGLGKRVTASMVDKWAMYTIGQYCDEPVPTGNTSNVLEAVGGGQFTSTGQAVAGVPVADPRFEPRFTCNCVINTKEDAYRVLNQLASVFRAMPYWSTGSVFLTQDAPAAPSYRYTNANVEGGLFDYAGSGRTQRHTVAMVGWNDPREDFKQKFEYVEDRAGIARYGVRSTEVVAFGCTSRSQARRVGLWLLYTERMETEAISFTTGLDSAKVLPGNTVEIADQHRAGARWGGRIISAHRNYMLYSQVFSDAVWSKTSSGGGSVPTVTDNDSTAPDGTVTAARVVFDRTTTAGDDSSIVSQAVTMASASTVSIWMRSTSGDDQYVLLRAGATGAYTEVKATGEWQRFELPSASAVSGAVEFGLRRTHGVQQPLTADVLVWGAQCNLGTKALGYVTTTISAADGVELDAAVQLSAGTYTLGLMNQDMTTVDKTVTVSGSTRSFKVLPVATPFASYPQPMSIWTLKSTVVTPIIGRVITVKQKSDVSFEIVCLEHNPSKYSAIENGTAPEIQNYTFLTLDQLPRVTGLTAVENSFKRTVTSPVQSDLFISWDASTSPLVRGYRIQVTTSSETVTLPEQTNPYVTMENLTPGSYTVQVSAVSHLGRPGLIESQSVTITGVDTKPPADVQNFQGSVTVENGVSLFWDDVPDFIDYFEIREGSTVESSTLVDRVKATSKRVGAVASGPHTYYVRAIDTSGNPSTNWVSTVVTVATAVAPVLGHSIEGPDEIISWTAPSSPFGIDRYEIREGDTFGASTFVDSTKATGYRRKVTYSGSKTYWVAAIDRVGNTGDFGSMTVNVAGPGPVTSTRAEIVDNNALLYWSPPSTGNLPVDRYEVRRGGTVAFDGQLVGSNGNSTFTPIFESAAGLYTYWVAAYDSAGTRGTPVAILAQISQPPDYILRVDYLDDFTGTASGMYADEGKLWGPTRGETFEQHFVNLGWTTPEQQQAAGYQNYYQPSAASGTYSRTLDYFDGLPETAERILPATTINIEHTMVVEQGVVTASVQISYKATAAGSWILAPAGATSVLASNFRYVKVDVTYTSNGGGDDLARVDALHIKLAAKQKTDSGNGTANSADSGGTLVNFNLDFVSVESITVTPGGTAARYGLYNFAGGDNPTSFQVLLFDNNGNRVSGAFSWSARGY